MLFSPFFQIPSLPWLSFSPFLSSLHPPFSISPLSSQFSGGSLSEDRPPASPQGHPPSRCSPYQRWWHSGFSPSVSYYFIHFFLFLPPYLPDYLYVVVWRSFITGRQHRKLWQEERQEIKEGECWMITLELFSLRHTLLEYQNIDWYAKTHNNKKR